MSQLLAAPGAGQFPAPGASSTTDGRHARGCAEPTRALRGRALGGVALVAVAVVRGPAVQPHRPWRRTTGTVRCWASSSSSPCVPSPWRSSRPCGTRGSRRCAPAERTTPCPACVAAVALVLLALGPVTAGNHYYALRPDLLALPLVAVAAVCLVFGVRALVAFVAPLAVLLVAWPLPLRAVAEPRRHGRHDDDVRRRRAAAPWCFPWRRWSRGR